MNRRDFLKIAGLAVGGGLVTATSYLALNDESQDPVIDRVPISINNLHPALEGFTVLQITDLHLYPLTQPALIKKTVIMANELKPDLVVLTGDYVWQDLEAIHELAPILSGLNARYGVFSTLGNHDYWLDADVITAAMESAGLPVLINQGHSIQHGNGSIYLAGLDDGWSGNPDLNATLDGAASNEPIVLLCHEPDLADQYALDGRIDLQLSGHSHGGQIRLPGIGALILPYLGRKYDLGLYKVNDMQLYTNRGLGVISEPVRFNCPPEISQFVLNAA
ncbi:MAG: metallophosphoesterase [Anaerolineales bacterium]|nr:metallophosphoesterase [Anaerolineales bacterium]HUV26372.1 metallophosphoesterase [Anaerolineales bacterium]